MKSKFNKANHNIGWSQYSWNPITGCLGPDGDGKLCPYCLHPDTLILMVNGTHKKIKDLKIGDKIIGTEEREKHSISKNRYRCYKKTTVLSFWKAVKKAFKITLANGTELICSEDHRWLTHKGKWEFVVGAEQGKNRRPHLTLNDSLRGFGRATQTPYESNDYMLGYLSGMIRGDAHLAFYDYERKGRKNGFQYQFRLALIDSEAIIRSKKYLSYFGVNTNNFMFTDKMSGIRTNSQSSYNKINKLILYKTNKEYLRGFLAGAYDAEGSFSCNNLRIPNSDKEYLDTFMKACKKLKINCKIEKGYKSTGIKKVKTLRIFGGITNHVKFFSIVDPAIVRKGSIAGKAVQSAPDLKIIKIENLNKSIEMYDIMTGTEDFVANGIVSHNCYANRMTQRFGQSFKPAFHPERLESPQNTPVPKIGSTRVFTGSMGELFGPWISNDWICQIFDVVYANPQWTFLFLTKCPERLPELVRGLSYWPENAWIGATIDRQKRVQKTIDSFLALRKVGIKNKLFISCEPLLEEIKIPMLGWLNIDWCIMGALSKGKQKIQPEISWVEHLFSQARLRGVPVWFKDNLIFKPQEVPSDS